MIIAGLIQLAFKAVKFESAQPLSQAAPKVSDDGQVANDAFSDAGLHQNARYDLAQAIRIVRAMETSPPRTAVFDEIKRKNTLYRMVDRLYTVSGHRFFQPLILFAYMVKCVMFLGPFSAKDATAAAISQFPNEHKTLDRVERLAGNTRVMRISFSRWCLATCWRMRRCSRRPG